MHDGAPKRAKRGNVHAYCDGPLRITIADLVIGVAALGGVKLIRHGLLPALAPDLPVLPNYLSCPIWLIVFLILFFILYGIFTGWLWRYFLIPRIAKICDFNGTYEGTCQGSVCDAAGNAVTSPSTLKIRQYWHRIEISFRMDGIEYTSRTAAILRNRPMTGDIELIFYFSQGATHYGTASKALYGTAVLRTKDRHHLTGQCFTDTQAIATLNFDRAGSRR